MQKSEVASVVYSEYDEQFQFVGIIALIMLIIEVIVFECKPKWQKRMSLFKPKGAAKEA